jgi:sterol desaturase/sphingolipid hydroxylase (fatty acid hydroxylase superfamily)
MAAFIAALLSLVVLSAAFIPLERSFPARPGQPILRPRLAIDACFFFGQYLFWNGLSIAILSALERSMAAGESGHFRSWVATWPGWTQAAAAVLLGDFLVYWFHRACHTFEPLWHFHAVHHSAEHLDFLAAHREHPLDGICTQLAANLPAFLLGFDLRSLAALIAFRGMWAIFVHSNVRIPLGPLRILFGAPELHHWHHARTERTRHNFANLAPWLDVLFGTHHCPSAPETYELGLDGPWPEGYVAQLVHPFRMLARRVRRPNRLTESPLRAPPVGI